MPPLKGLDEHTSSCLRLSQRRMSQMADRARHASRRLQLGAFLAARLVYARLGHLPCPVIFQRPSQGGLIREDALLDGDIPAFMPSYNVQCAKVQPSPSRGVHSFDIFGTTRASVPSPLWNPNRKNWGGDRAMTPGPSQSLPVERKTRLARGQRNLICTAG